MVPSTRNESKAEREVRRLVTRCLELAKTLGRELKSAPEGSLLWGESTSEWRSRLAACSLEIESTARDAITILTGSRSSSEEQAATGKNMAEQAGLNAEWEERIEKANPAQLVWKERKQEGAEHLPMVRKGGRERRINFHGNDDSASEQENGNLTSEVEASRQGAGGGNRRRKESINKRKGFGALKRVVKIWRGNNPEQSDNYVWRKYGEKRILGTNFRRSYFRCTHMTSDVHCPVRKQVQQCEQEPCAFTITYFGDHTCAPPPLENPSMIFRCPTTLSFLLANAGQNPPDFPSPGNLLQLHNNNVHGSPPQLLAEYASPPPPPPAPTVPFPVPSNSFPRSCCIAQPAPHLSNDLQEVPKSGSDHTAITAQFVETCSSGQAHNAASLDSNCDFSTLLSSFRAEPMLSDFELGFLPLAGVHDPATAEAACVKHVIHGEREMLPPRLRSESKEAHPFTDGEESHLKSVLLQMQQASLISPATPEAISCGAGAAGAGETAQADSEDSDSASSNDDLVVLLNPFLQGENLGAQL